MKPVTFVVLLFPFLLSASPTPQKNDPTSIMNIEGLTGVEDLAVNLITDDPVTTPGDVGTAHILDDITCNDCQNRLQGCIDVNSFPCAVTFSLCLITCLTGSHRR
jgi:hypothetical protein